MDNMSSDGSYVDTGSHPSNTQASSEASRHVNSRNEDFSGYQNSPGGTAPSANTQQVHNNIPNSSNGWSGAYSTNVSSDDGGWGESAPVTDWGENYMYNQQYQSAQQGSWAGQTDGASSNLDDQGFNPYGSVDPQEQAYDQSQYTYETDPNSGYPGPQPGSNANTWEFFADSGRQSSGRFTGSQDIPQDPAQPSDVTALSRTEMDAVLPITPTGRQADYFRPRNLSERVVQIAGSLATSMLLSKSTVLAAPALLYPLWSPWVRAALKNVEVYGNQLKVLGLWRAQVLEVEILQSSTFRPGWSLSGARAPTAGAVIRLLMGDPWEGGARVQLEFPYQPKAELIEPGESVESLVLCKDNTFNAFKVIREVYAPGLGLWLAEYPFVDRTAFLDVSLQIERSRQADPSMWGYTGSAPGGGAAAASRSPTPGVAGYGVAGESPIIVDVDPVDPFESWGYDQQQQQQPWPSVSSSAVDGSSAQDVDGAAYGSASPYAAYGPASRSEDYANGVGNGYDSDFSSDEDSEPPSTPEMSQRQGNSQTSSTDRRRGVYDNVIPAEISEPTSPSSVHHDAASQQPTTAHAAQHGPSQHDNQSPASQSYTDGADGYANQPGVSREYTDHSQGSFNDETYTYNQGYGYSMHNDSLQGSPQASSYDWFGTGSSSWAPGSTSQTVDTSSWFGNGTSAATSSGSQSVYSPFNQSSSEYQPVNGFGQQVPSSSSSEPGTGTTTAATNTTTIHNAEFYDWPSSYASVETSFISPDTASGNAPTQKDSQGSHAGTQHASNTPLAPSSGWASNGDVTTASSAPRYDGNQQQQQWPQRPTAAAGGYTKATPAAASGSATTGSIDAGW